MSTATFRMFIVLAVLVAGSVAYLNTLDGKWVWDDASSVLLHKHVQNPKDFFQLFKEDQHAFGRGAGNFYRPLVSVSFMIDFLLSTPATLENAPNTPYPDVSPTLFHVTNTIWHLLAALLLFALLIRCNAPKFVQASVPLLYILHPLHTEAVAYISGRADMMSAAFVYAALWCALIQGSLSKKILGWVLSLLAFSAALLSKESAFIYPVLLLLCILLRPLDEIESSTSKIRRYLQRSLPFLLSLIVLGIYAALRTTVLKFADTAQSSVAPLSQRLVECCQAFAFYFRVLFLPTGLHMEQSLANASTLSTVIGLLLIVLCLSIFLFCLYKKYYRISLGVAWFLLSWLPISGIFPLNAPMAEHWMYIPMAGFWWALTEILWRVSQQSPKTRTIPIIATSLFCLLLLGLTVQRNQDWHSNETLFRATLRENPTTLRVHYNLAVAYEDLDHNLPGAQRHYEAALSLIEKAKMRKDMLSGEQELEIRLALGRVLAQRKQYQNALGQFLPLTTLKDIQQYGAYVKEAAFHAGKCSLALGDIRQANHFFTQVLKLDPTVAHTVEELLMGAPLYPTHP